MALYLITGGAGFIGSHLTEELVRRGDSVRVLDNLSNGRLDNLLPVFDDIEFHNADVRDLEAIQPYFAGVDSVIHLAAIASVQRSMQDPEETTRVNLNGALNVLSAARANGVRRVVMASTAAAYGNDPHQPHAETHPPQPLSPYAITKVATEYYGQIFNRHYGIEVVSLRYFNLFGPRQDPESAYTGVLSIFISHYLRGAAPVIYGDGLQSRDFTYVANAVDATLRSCTAPFVPGFVINVGTGKSSTLHDVIQALNRMFGVQMKPRYASARLGDVRHSCADITRARGLLRYEPLVSFEDGLKETVNWFRTALTAV